MKKIVKWLVVAISIGIGLGLNCQLFGEESRSTEEILARVSKKGLHRDVRKLCHNVAYLYVAGYEGNKVGGYHDALAYVGYFRGISASLDDVIRQGMIEGRDAWIDNREIGKKVNLHKMFKECKEISQKYVELMRSRGYDGEFTYSELFRKAGE